jgi:hypothetical protein
LVQSGPFCGKRFDFAEGAAGDVTSAENHVAEPEAIFLPALSSLAEFELDVRPKASNLDGNAQHNHFQVVS